MKKRDVIRLLSRIMFVVYMLLIIYLLFVSDVFGRNVRYEEMRVNLQPFHEIGRFALYGNNYQIIINILGNILAFVPFGALIRWVFNKKTHWYQATFYTFVFSFTVELLQLISKVGVFDVDDLILNTIGGLVGFWIYYIILLINRRREKLD